MKTTVFASVITASACALAVMSAAEAQNTSGVFSPVVDADDHEMQLRTGLSPLSGSPSLAYRLHYQKALNDTVRLRAIVGYADPAGGDLEPIYLQGEMLWQIVEETPGGYAAGVRVDVRANEGDDRSHQLGVNWSNQWALPNGWRVRAIALLDADFGDRARDGLFLGARSSLTRRLDNGLRAGIEHFSDFGGTDAGLGGFDDQEHTIGPVISGAFNADWSWHAGVQLALSDAANDADLQLRIGREF